MVTLDIKYIGDDILLAVFDEDAGSDDLIGTADIKVSSMCIGSGIDEWYKIQFKGKEAGVIHLRSVWEPRAAPLSAAPLVHAPVAVVHTDGMVAQRQVSATVQIGGPQHYPPQQMGGYPQAGQPQMGGYPQQYPPQ